MEYLRPFGSLEWYREKLITTPAKKHAKLRTSYISSCFLY